MGNDPILSLSQSEVLNLYTMVTVNLLVSSVGFELTLFLVPNEVP